jgi:excisionase family DNA binding protein
MIPGYLTTKQVAKMHGVTPSSVVLWIQNGYLKATKVNQIWLIEEEDAKNYKRRPITGRPKKC